MIISIRGPSGSGKSTLVRAIVSHYKVGITTKIEGRKKPLAISYQRYGEGKNLMVPGHYEIVNGGIDTLPSLESAYELARIADSQNVDVLMEGKCMSDGTTHVARIQHEKRSIIAIVHLNTSVEECLASVQQRGHNIALRSIQKTHRKVETNVSTFRDMGLHVFSGNRAQCAAHIKELLGL